jgi:hypothetical protein
MSDALMQNVKVTQKGDKLTIEVDVSKAVLTSAAPYASGKTRTVATTRGNQVVAMVDGKAIVLGLNAYFKG